MQTIVDIVRFVLNLLRSDIRFFEAYPIVGSTVVVLAIAVAAYVWRYIK